MIRILNYIMSVFFLEIVIWVGSGFLNKKISLSLMFIPIFFIGLGVGLFIDLIIKNKRKSLNHYQTILLILASLIVFVLVVTWLLNFYLFHLPWTVKIFNLIIPLSIFLLPLFLLLIDVNENDFLRLFKTLKFWFWINLIISILLFLVINLFHLIPTSSFFYNSHYRVSIFLIGGEKYLRVPGIFESGGANGAYLLLFFNYYLAKQFENKSRKNIIILVLIGMTILMTITRRCIIAMFLMLTLYNVISSFRKKEKKIFFNPVKIYSLLSMIFIGIFGLIYFIPDLFKSTSLFARFYFWQKNLNDLLGQHWYTILKGYGVIQSSFEFIHNKSFFYIDNGYLAILIYGGIFLLLLFLIYYFLMLLNNINNLVNELNEKRWINFFNILNILTMFFLMLFTSMIFSLTSIIFYVIIIHLITTMSNDYANKSVKENNVLS